METKAYDEIKNKIRNSWPQMRAGLKAKYSQIRDEDLVYEAGQEERVIGTLEKRLGKSRAEIGKLLRTL